MRFALCGKHAAAPFAQALLIFEPAQFLGRAHRRLTVGAHTKPPVHVEKARGVEKAVAQIRFGADGDADDRVGCSRDALQVLRRWHGLHEPRTSIASATLDPAAIRSDGGPSRASQARTSSICSATWMCTGMLASMLRNARAASRKRSAARRAGCGMPRRCAAGASPARPLVGDAPFDGAQELLSVQEKSRLLGFERLTAEVAALVKRRQKRQPNAGGACGMADRLPQGIRDPNTARRHRPDANSEIPRPTCSLP